jgi:hypothetical protein
MSIKAFESIKALRLFSDSKHSIKKGGKNYEI